jgi:hypothetical protein
MQMRPQQSPSQQSEPATQTEDKQDPEYTEQPKGMMAT